MAITDGGPAFPTQRDDEVYRDGEFHPTLRNEGGMSLRDYFAGQALIGICSGANAMEVVSLAKGESGGSVQARAAYCLADALLKAREAQ